MSNSAKYPHMVLVGLPGVDPSLIAQGEALAASMLAGRDIDPVAAWTAYAKHGESIGAGGPQPRDQMVLATLFLTAQSMAIEHALDPGPARPFGPPVAVPAGASLQVQLRDYPQSCPAGVEVLGYVTVDHGCVIQKH